MLTTFPECNFWNFQKSSVKILYTIIDLVCMRMMHCGVLINMPNSSSKCMYMCIVHCTYTLYPYMGRYALMSQRLQCILLWWKENSIFEYNKKVTQWTMPIWDENNGELGHWKFPTRYETNRKIRLKKYAAASRRGWATFFEGKATLAQIHQQLCAEF